MLTSIIFKQHSMVESAPNMVKLTVGEFSKLVVNTRDMYEAMVRNGWYLPRFKSTMITELYMNNVMSGKAFCPKFEDIKLLPCRR